MQLGIHNLCVCANLECHLGNMHMVVYLQHTHTHSLGGVFL